MSLRRKSFFKFLLSMIERKKTLESVEGNFTLPEEEDPENPVIEPLIKSHALKKMADLFRRWKNELKTKYVDQDKTPEFTGQFDKIRDH